MMPNLIGFIDGRLYLFLEQHAFFVTRDIPFTDRSNELKNQEFSYKDNVIFYCVEDDVVFFGC